MSKRADDEEAGRMTMFSQGVDLVGSQEIRIRLLRLIDSVDQAYSKNDTERCAAGISAIYRLWDAISHEA